MINFPRYSVSRRISGRHLDTTDTLTFFNCELDIALVTPNGVPGVLNKPVFLPGSSIRAITDSEDGVVKFSATFCGV